ncbi:MAG: cob(I)yrinic acid a,c-diamide adenosyltransferase [Candidatus Paceibacterota bacterium]|jgi:cob(I)alamin adenosyltransferase
MIFVLTGKGKGKTTSAVGMGIRAAGAGKAVLMIQFLKDGSSSENKAIAKIRNFKVKAFGRKGFAPYGDKDRALAKKALDFLRKEIGGFQMAILDEINVALDKKMVEIGEIVPILEKYGKSKDLVLTGRNAPAVIVKKADLVTEFKEVKHYFNKGIKAKKGIEY